MRPLTFLLMLLVGALIIAMVFALRRGKPKDSAASANPPVCPSCGQANQPDAQYCGKCGGDLSDV